MFVACPAARETPAKQQKFEDGHEWLNKALDHNGGPAMRFGRLVTHWRASVGQLGRSVRRRVWFCDV